MKPVYWKPSKQKIAARECLEHTATKELALVGLYGEIFVVTDSTCKAIITSARIAKRYLARAGLFEGGWPVREGDEVPYTFPVEDLPLWLKRLRVPMKAKSQAILANANKKNTHANSNLGAAESAVCVNLSSNEPGPYPGIPQGSRIDLPSQTENRIHQASVIKS